MSMQFVHRTYQPGDTIAAIASPPGEGGVAVIRISGTEALAIATKVFSGPIHTYRSHTVHLGKIVGSAGNVIDEVLALVMRSPRSYTGEDTVEIHCHGGSLISRSVLEAILKAGARAAEPGEFTFRAFINGKIDLAQAEAVQELISAKNTLALTVAEQHLEGRLSQQISSLQQALIDTAAILEAWVDFPEEDLDFGTMDEIILSLENTFSKMEHLNATFHEGRVVQCGLSLCLVGPPNVGKSSLMNALLGKERAIVTAIPGTTRDLLEEELRLGNLHFRLIDTAGIRETQELVEQEGIRRSKEAMHTADVVLLVLDASAGLCAQSETLLATAPLEKTLLIWNKIDLPHSDISYAQCQHVAHISAKTGAGFDLLKQEIERLIWCNGLPSKEEVIITNLRHHQALSHASSVLRTLIDGLKSGISPEFLASDMRTVLRELGTIIGNDISEEILSAIFSKFCVGK